MSAGGDPLAPLRTESWIAEARRKAIHLAFLVLPLALLYEPLPWPRGRAQWSWLLIVLVAGAVVIDVVRIHDRRLGNLDLVSVDRNGHPSLSRQMLDHSLGTADLLGHRDGFMARSRRLAADVENVRAFADHHHGLGDGGLSVVEPVAAERVGTHVDDAHHIGPPAPLEPMPGDVGSLHGPIMLPPYQ